MSEYLSSYSNKKVFITGHTGFKGSWLTFLLKEIGAEVKGYALKPLTEPNLFNLLGLENSILNVEADLREGNRLKKEILDFQPEFIFHLGAQALVKRSYSNPVETYETNIMGSVNLLEAVRYCDSLRSLVYITSDNCYENVEWLRGYR